ncbi:hypothetical protein HCH_06371 [Hahella chejuensis KCTC 2396]|uniref:Uncharacterized protein n=1 Tax=Hahella chejuensis (strain KCTC 2396) TaxID=349521 RepID=Q2S8K8_HAHCH|nr:hypothetical protein [Hahella chejuensis]ABC33016.1 hypothetical protein HCH_06371 [Hahella chejuensis KCTC 2396]
MSNTYEINHVIGVCGDADGNVYQLYTHYDESDALAAVGTIKKATTDKNGIVLGGKGTRLLYANTQMNAMWMSPEGHLWVVDRKGNVYTNAPVTFVNAPYQHLDYKDLDSGVQWNVTLIDRNSLQGIWGSSDSDVWVTSFNGQAFHWDGKSWTMHAIGNTSNGINGSASNDVYVVGYHGKIHHFDGSSWSDVPYPAHLPEGEVFTDVRVVSKEEVYITGRSGGVLKGNALDGFQDIGSPEYKWYGVGYFKERLFFAGGPSGIFELKDGRFECLKDRADIVGVFEAKDAIYFIPAEQQPRPWVVQYQPGADMEWAKINS